FLVRYSPRPRLLSVSPNPVARIHVTRANPHAVIEDAGQASYFAVAGGPKALLVTVFEINRDVLLTYIVRSHMSESRAQLPLYDVCVIALCGHRLFGKTIYDKIIHHSRKRTGALREYLPQVHS